MSDSLEQPSAFKSVDSVTTGSTALGNCQHCFCVITTNGDLLCHRCNVTKPYEPPKPQKCIMCGGTGITYQARSHEGDIELDDPIV